MSFAFIKKYIMIDISSLITISLMNLCTVNPDYSWGTGTGPVAWRIIAIREIWHLFLLPEWYFDKNSVKKVDLEK